MVLLLFAAFGSVLVYQSLKPPKPDIARVVVPGETSLNLEDDIYLIYYESRSAVDGRQFSTDQLPELLNIKVTSPGGAAVETDPAREVTYELGGRSGRSILEFWIEEDGKYLLSASYPQGVDGPEVVLAVGVDPGGPQVAVFAGVLSLLAIAFSTALVRSALSRRARARDVPEPFDRSPAEPRSVPDVQRGPFTSGNLRPMETSRRKWLPIEMMEKAGEALSVASVEITTDREVYCAGDTVEANVDITAEKPCVVEEGIVSLLCWYGYEYSGSDNSTRYTETRQAAGQNAILAGRRLLPGEKVTEVFRAAIPADSPPTAAGILVQVRWEVNVELKMAGVDSRGRHPVRVLSSPVEQMPDPDSRGGQFAGYELRTSVDRSTVRLGDAVEGKVTVTPQSTLKANTIELSLVYREKVSTGSVWAWSHPKSIDLTVAENPDLPAGVPSTYPFSIPVPTNAFPTLKTPYFENSWVLWAKVNRRFRKDEAVEVPIVILTAQP